MLKNDKTFHLLLCRGVSLHHRLRPCGSHPLVHCHFSRQERLTIQIRMSLLKKRVRICSFPLPWGTTAADTDDVEEVGFLFILLFRHNPNLNKKKIAHGNPPPWTSLNGQLRSLCRTTVSRHPYGIMRRLCTAYHSSSGGATLRPCASW
jgi:hypothetical protein